MNKVIVKSLTTCFGGLYFRRALTHSIEWTSFELAAAVFDHENHAIVRMGELGIMRYNIEPAPAPVPSKNFTPIKEQSS